MCNFTKIKTRMLLVLLLLIVEPAFPLGQGLYLKINSENHLSISVQESHCVEGANTITLNKKVYLKSNLLDSGGACKINFSLLDTNQNKVATYEIEVGVNALSVDNTFLLDSYLQSYIVYPRYSSYPVDSTEFVVISITKNKPSQWMDSLSNKIMDESLNRIFIPGTHDSGTYTISSNSTVMPDVRSYLYYAYSYGASYSAGWAKTQHYDITAQLHSGIRYFDLRLCGEGLDIDKIYACHALRGESLKKIVGSVKEFLNQKNHQHEIIILDVNHWYNTNVDDLPTMQKNVLNFINDELSPWVAPRRDLNGENKYTPSTKLSTFWNDKKQVIIASTIVPHEALFNYVWYSVNSSDLADCAPQSTDLCSYWPNKQDANELKQSISSTLEILRETPPPYLFILQTQLTPSVSTITSGMSMLEPTNLMSLTGAYKDDIITYLQNDEIFKGIEGVIFIEDFSNGFDLTREVLRLNER